MSEPKPAGEWKDPRMCKGLEMIARGMEACDSVVLAPRHEYDVGMPWTGDVCPTHHVIREHYLRQNFTVHYRKEVRNDERRE